MSTTTEPRYDAQRVSDEQLAELGITRDQAERLAAVYQRRAALDWYWREMDFLAVDPTSRDDLTILDGVAAILGRPVADAERAAHYVSHRRNTCGCAATPADWREEVEMMGATLPPVVAGKPDPYAADPVADAERVERERES